MKKSFPYKIMATAALTAAVVVPGATFAAETNEVQLKTGIYFYSQTGVGEYYSLGDWAVLPPIQKGQLIQQYGSENISVFEKNTNKVATLKAISNSGKPFVQAAKDYKLGDIVGSYKNATDDDDIITIEDPAQDGLIVDNVLATTEAGVTTVTASVTNAEEDAKATVTITPDEAIDVEALAAEYNTTVEVILDLLTKEVDVVDGKVTAIFEGLLPGTHTATVAIGDVNDSVVFTVEASVELTVESVMAITDTVFDKIKTQLQFSINGEEEAADLEAVKEAGYEVKFLKSNSANSTSEVQTSSAFSYVVEVSKDGEVVATSAEKSVTVLNGSDAAKITKHEITQDNKKVGTVVVGMNAKLTITEYETLAGRTVETLVPGVSYKSSNTAVAIVDSSGNIIPLREGTVNITVSKKNMEDYVVELAVKADARTATTVTGLTNVSLSVAEDRDPEEKDVTIKVVDQYGDIVTGKDLLVSSSDVDVATTAGVTTTAKGEAVITVTAVKAGTSTLTVKDGDKTLATSTITVEKAGAVASYNLEYASDKDTTLDLGGDDTSLTVNFVSRDANGLLVKNLVGEIGPKYTLESSKPGVATANVDGNRILVEAVSTGTTTISIKEGSLTRASLVITVENTTKPAVQTIGNTSVDAELVDLQAEFDNSHAFALTSLEDEELTLTYTSGEKVGILPKLTFNGDAKVASVAVNGTELDSDSLAQLILKAGGTNFVTNYVESIELGAILGKDGDNIAEIASEISVTLENRSGYTTTYTINLVKAAPAQ